MEIMKKILLIIVLIYSYLPLWAGNIYVVSVGIAGYKNIPSLRLPEKDAKALAALYKKKTKNVILITGKYANKSNIIKSLKSQFARANRDDMIVFSFSGHGYQGGFCPYDMTNNLNSGLSYDEIYGILKQSKAKQKIILADACFSGGLRTDGTQQANQQKFNTNIILFLSSRTGESSIESPFMVNGYFTTFLLNGLKGSADTDRNKIITAKELYHYVSLKVKDKSKNRQHPVMWGNFDDNTIIIDWR